MSPIAATNVLAVIALTPGTVINRRTSAEASASRAIAFSSSETSPSRKSMWRRQPVIVSHSSSGSASSASHGRPLTPKYITDHLVKNHPLPDGNKRAAWVAMRVFLEINGRTWRAPPDVDDAERAVVAIASGEWDHQQMAAWLRDRVQPPPP
jgi:death-on-curing protein